MADTLFDHFPRASDRAIELTHFDYLLRTRARLREAYAYLDNIIELPTVKHDPAHVSTFHDMLNQVRQESTAALNLLITRNASK